MNKTEFEFAITADESTATATTAALETIRENLTADEVRLVVAMSSPKYDEQTITDELTAEFGEVPILGMTTTGEFGATDHGMGNIALAVIASDSLVASTAIAHGVSEDVYATVESAVDDLPDPTTIPAPHHAAITFHDGLAGVGEELTLVTNQLLGDIPLTGASAGDDLAMEETRVYTEDDVVTDGIVIALLGDEKPFGLGVNHGHKPISGYYEVTKSDDCTVFEIDGDPAFDVWKREVADLAREEYGVDVETIPAETEQLTDFLTRFQFGLKTGDDRFKIRWPGLTKATDGPLEFACGVPEGSKLKVMHSPKEDQVDSARVAVERATESMGENEIAGTLVFDCICHALILDDAFNDGVKAMDEASAAPLVGCETYGEVNMPSGANSGFHNTTTSVFMIPK
jgi:methyl-accepting chemotaxis protein